MATTKSRDRQPGWMRKLLPFLLHHKALLGLTFAAALAGMVATAVQPLIMRAIVDDAILADRRPIVPLLALMGGLGVFRLCIGFVRRYFGAKVGAAVDYDLRNAIFDHLQRLDFARHDAMQTGQLVSRANTDVAILRGVLGFLPIMSSNIVLFPVSLVFMVQISPLLSLVAVAIVPAFLALTMRARRVVYPSSWDASQRAAEVANVVDEAVTGVRIVKGFGQERRELGRLVAAAERLFGARMRNLRLSAKRQATLASIPLLGQVAVLAFGGLIAIDGGLTVGSFLAFLTYLAQLIAPIGMMAGMLVMTQTARAGAERIQEILDSTPEVVDRPGARTLHEPLGELVFDDVRFGYVQSQPVLDGFSLRVAPGETAALVGASGSGKSTVALLLPRFYDVQGGAVKVDGVDVRDLTVDSLRSHVGMVFEDAFLFSDTIRNNIAYGRPDATDEQVEAAARAAEAHRFITELPDGYDTVVGERGLSLSGGQRQRISLARAILTDPRILLLDDATSSIDVKVEEEIHRTLRALMKGRTTVLIAHRRSSLELADRIVVMDKGRVLDHGTHEELMARCRHYALLLSGPGEGIDALPTGARPAGDGAPEPATAPVRAAVPGPVAPAARAATPPRPTGGMPLRPAGAPGMAGIGTAGMRGMGMRGLSMPPEELEAAIAALPPVRDVAHVDTEHEAADHGGFSLGGFLRPYRRPLLLGAVLVAGNALATLAGPYLIRQGVDRGVIPGDRGALFLAAGLFVLATVVARSLSWFASVYTGRTAQRMLLALRVRVFSHLQRLGLDFYDEEMDGRVMTRMTSDIEALNSMLQTGMTQSLVHLVTFTGTAVILFTMNVTLAACVLLVVPPLAAATLLYRRESAKAYTRVREGVAAVNASFQEGISGIRVAKAFTREQRNMDSYRQVTGEYLDARLDSQRISSLYFPFVELMSVAANVIVLGVGAGLVARDSLTPGALIAFSLYISTVFAPLQQLSALFDTYQQAKAAMDKLRELLGTPTSVPQAAAPVRVHRVSGSINFDDVRFAYRTARVEALQGTTFEIPAGQTVALVGETGAGKSTIVKLLARFYDPTAGCILVDGVPLTDVDLEGYRRCLGYVPQEPFLFSGTIRDNLAYGRPDAGDDEIRAAAEAVGAAEFIEQLPHGYDQPVSERGRSLSAGQRQLVALARALLVDPAILLLDEATANLDLATEARVNRAMGVVSAGRTTVLVAHRLPTAHQADRILVIDRGRVVEDGAPAALLAAGGRYADLWRTYQGDAVPA